MRTGTHYLDLAGEVPEYRSLEARDQEARAAGIMLLPGAGFGCVPTDCLAFTAPVSYATMVNSSRRERPRTRPSSTSKTATARPSSSPTRGEPISSPPATRPTCPNVETFAALRTPVRVLMRHGRRARPLLDSRLWQGLVRTITARMREGPDRTELETGRSVCWARATPRDGTVATSTLRGPDAYLFTALAAAMCTRLILAGHATPGLRHTSHRIRRRLRARHPRRYTHRPAAARA
jgi:saccharopine dehydrogenase (NAD+, L-lysine-forming)